jgi:hypothetical protein
MEHGAKLHAQSLEALRLQHQMELESLRQMHEREVHSLRQRETDGVFLQALVSKVETSASSLESLQQKVTHDRAVGDKAALQQITAREQLLREKEDRLNAARAHNESLLATFQNLTTEHDGERARLKSEHIRLEAMQRDFRAESAVLREGMTAELEQLRKERMDLRGKKEAWAAKHQREASELETKQDMAQRTQSRATEMLQESQKERATIMRELDSERSDLRAERQALAMRKKRQDQEGRELNEEKEQFQHKLRFFEQKMHEMTELGNRVKRQSEEVAAKNAESQQA